MSDLTPEALDRLAQLDADATPGPWFAWDRGVGWQVALDPDGRRMLPEGMRTDLAREADAALIAAMRTHLPALLDEVKQGRVRRTAERIVRDDLRAERDALTRWKAEALPVMAGLQELGRALGVDLGKQITARESVDLALDLRNRATRAERKVADMQGTEAVLRGEIRRAESALATFEKVVEERDAARAEVAALHAAALADTATDKEADA